MTNRKLSQSQQFLERCRQAGIKPTVRQASKYSRGEGACYKIAVRGRSDIHIPPQARWKGK